MEFFILIYRASEMRLKKLGDLNILKWTTISSHPFTIFIFSLYISLIFVPNSNKYVLIRINILLSSCASGSMSCWMVNSHLMQVSFPVALTRSAFFCRRKSSPQHAATIAVLTQHKIYFSVWDYLLGEPFSIYLLCPLQ